MGGHLHRTVDQRGQPVVDTGEQSEVGHGLRVGVREQPRDPAHQPAAGGRRRPGIAYHLGAQRQQRLGHLVRLGTPGARDDENAWQADHHPGFGPASGRHHDSETVKSRHRRAPRPSFIVLYPPILPVDRARVSNLSATDEVSGVPGASAGAGDQPRVLSRCSAALIRARWVNACGKLPSASPDGPISSA